MVQPITAAVLEITHRTRLINVTCNTNVQFTTYYGSPNYSSNDEKMAVPSTVRISARFSPGDFDVMKEYEMITLIYNRKSCRLYLLSF